MTSPKATARGLWLLSNNTYTYQEFDGVTWWRQRCQESIGLNNKAEVLEGAIQVFEIERFLQVDI